jgi:hypothetical protein
MQPLEESAGTVDSSVPAEGSAATLPANAETGGPTGPEPTRYGDWERRGRCIDF